ncbi:hypothetical protein [Streptomyces sp. PR69]|uniref:hypothetical protein n=1 Tax=Streptomyces sp. PR69 TaxID=2984950 RepID=UPI002264B393|nr:hypothetical protein [Streptomyces sp. PR69]
MEAWGSLDISLSLNLTAKTMNCLVGCALPFRAAQFAEADGTFEKGVSMQLDNETAKGYVKFSFEGQDIRVSASLQVAVGGGFEIHDVTLMRIKD